MQDLKWGSTPSPEDVLFALKGVLSGLTDVHADQMMYS